MDTYRISDKVVLRQYGEMFICYFKDDDRIKYYSIEGITFAIVKEMLLGKTLNEIRIELERKKLEIDFEKGKDELLKYKIIK